MEHTYAGFPTCRLRRRRCIEIFAEIQPNLNNLTAIPTFGRRIRPRSAGLGISPSATKSLDRAAGGGVTAVDSLVQELGVDNKYSAAVHGRGRRHCGD